MSALCNHARIAPPQTCIHGWTHIPMYVQWSVEKLSTAKDIYNRSFIAVAFTQNAENAARFQTKF